MSASRRARWVPVLVVCLGRLTRLVSIGCCGVHAVVHGFVLMDMRVYSVRVNFIRISACSSACC